MPFIVSIKLLCIAVPMIQNLETTLRTGAVPQAPQFRPSAVQSVPQVLKKVDTPAKSQEKLVRPAVLQSRKLKLWSRLQLCQLEHHKRNLQLTLLEI
ncbi:hypothetical protein Hanom_Chr15g01350581 [Helianthus anomalus]